jgi:hypothetical protein
MQVSDLHPGCRLTNTIKKVGVARMESPCKRNFVIQSVLLFTLCDTSHRHAQSVCHPGAVAVRATRCLGNGSLRAGTDPSSRTTSGRTPLSTANQFGRDDILEELLSDVKDSPGQQFEASGGTMGGSSTVRETT